MIEFLKTDQSKRTDIAFYVMTALTIAAFWAGKDGWETVMIAYGGYGGGLTVIKGLVELKRDTQKG